MLLPRYFKTGQKVQLRSTNPLSPEGQDELLSATLEGINEQYFDLRLSYAPHTLQGYPFAPGMPFELSTDSMGLGVKISVILRETLPGERIRVQVSDDLQMFQRRIQPRLDCTLGLRYTHGQNTLHGMRKAWEEETMRLAAASGLQSLEGFLSCQLNLSSRGIRFLLPPPVKPADICLVQIALADRKPPVCALAEIVWVSGPNRDGLMYAGMQFINILEQDRKRISLFVRDSS